MLNPGDRHMMALWRILQGTFAMGLFGASLMLIHMDGLSSGDRPGTFLFLGGLGFFAWGILLHRKYARILEFVIRGTENETDSFMENNRGEL